MVYCLFNFVHKKPNLTQVKQEFKYLRSVYVTLDHIFCIQTYLLQVSF